MSISRRFQRIFSIVPFFSTVVIVFVTMLRIKKASSSKLWFRFCSVTIGSLLVISFVNCFVMTGQHIILNIIVTALLLAVTNLLCVDIQAECDKYAEIEKTENDKKLVLVYVSLCAVMMAISLICIIVRQKNPSIVYKDMNGLADSSLSIITMEDIITTKAHYSAKGIAEKQYGERTQVIGDLKDHDYDTCIYNAQSFNGIKTIQVTKTKNDSITLEFKTTITSGNMEIIILVDDAYHCKVETTGTQIVTINGISGKTIVVKIAGESTQFNFQVQRLDT